jgi:predicted metal-binding protein
MNDKKNSSGKLKKTVSFQLPPDAATKEFQRTIDERDYEIRYIRMLIEEVQEKLQELKTYANRYFPEAEVLCSSCKSSLYSPCVTPRSYDGTSSKRL